MEKLFYRNLTEEEKSIISQSYWYEGVNCETLQDEFNISVASCNRVINEINA